MSKIAVSAEQRSRLTLAQRPARGAVAGCAECGHPHALHSNGRTPCRAYACTAGPDGGPCQGFKEASAAA